MSNGLKRWLLTLAVSAGVAGVGAGLLGSSVARVHAAEQQPLVAPEQVASVDELKAEALKALKLGKFERGNELLTKAASVANDPTLSHWATWSSQFETQLKGFREQRHQDFQKFVDDVKKLEKAGKDTYLIEFARDAYLRADDKDEFVKEPWVQDIIQKSIALA